MDNIIRVELELTNTCNLKCPLCIRQTHNFEKNNKEFRRVEDIVKQLNQFPNLQYVTIAGQTSEPTLYPQLFKLIQYLISIRQVEVSLYINGETYDDSYYKKLGILFMRGNSRIYLTICGSTNELHSKYRIGSTLENVLYKYSILNNWSDNKCILTWLIFDYNYDDYIANKYKFKDCNLEVFNTLPINAAYKLDNHEFNLPNNLNDVYNELQTTWHPRECRSDINKFRIIDFKGHVYPCSMFKNFGNKYCYECQETNYKKLHSNGIFTLAESESETSEEEVRYDNN